MGLTVRLHRCKTGFFEITKNSLIEVEDAISKEADTLGLEPTYYSGKFVSTLKCSNSKCLETASIIGKTKIDFDGMGEAFLDEQGYEFPPQPKFKTKYIINLVDPPTRIIELPINISDRLKQQLNDSFKVFWLDNNSCGNAIRLSLEILMDELKIKKTTKNKKNKIVRLNLHSRIELYEKQQSIVGKQLMAIKFIGNESSHARINTSRKDIIDAFKILEFSLEKIYVDSEKVINKLVEKKDKRNRK